MRDILLITLLEGEENAQPGKLSEGDDDWFKPMGRKRETLGQRLTRKVAESIVMVTTTGRKFTEEIEPEIFPGYVATFAGDKEEGVMVVKWHPDGPGEISFSTDGSRLDSGRTGASVVLRDPDWKTRKTYLGTNKEEFYAELYSIGEAVEMALKNGRVEHGTRRTQAEPRWTRIHIWADFQTDLK